MSELKEIKKYMVKIAEKVGLSVGHREIGKVKKYTVYTNNDCTHNAITLVKKPADIEILDQCHGKKSDIEVTWTICYGDIKLKEILKIVQSCYSTICKHEDKKWTRSRDESIEYHQGQIKKLKKANKKRK